MRSCSPFTVKNARGQKLVLNNMPAKHGRCFFFQSSNYRLAQFAQRRHERCFESECCDQFISVASRVRRESKETEDRKEMEDRKVKVDR